MRVRTPAAPEGTILVEGHLLLTNKTLAGMLDSVIIVHVDACMGDMLMERKWARAHLGKKSYKDRGVSREDYATVSVYACICMYM